MNELIVLEKSGVNIDSIRKSGWIKIIEVTQRSAVNQLLIDLDLGEAEAKRGMINEMKSFVDRLMIKAKFRISNELYDRILVLANE